MKFKLILFFIFLFSLLGIRNVQAQSTDLRLSGHAIDSINAARKQSLESSAALRKYRNSKHYKDSLEHARKAKTKAIQQARLAKVDSMKQVRGKVTDSMLAIRKVKTDSVKVIQKKRTETVEKLKKYKSSKRFTDSVTIVRRERLDSSKRIQKTYRDSIARIRKHELDMDKSVRKHEADSVKMVRTKILDSMKITRKKHTDSLTKAKLAKGNKLKTKEKVSEEKKKLALEIAIKKKHEAFTNKTMLKKKWSPIRRLTQNSFTHYNYYYNSNRKLEEANANMLRGGLKENYDSMIKLYPFDPDRDSTLLASDMDSIIRKVSVGLQIHDPRVKWSNDMFLIMGQAYYYKGNYENAATTFRYILSADEENKKNERLAHKSKEGPSFVEEEKKGLNFLKHKSVHNDAILWLARTYVQEKQVENGQAVLSLLASDPKLPEDLLGKVAAGKAFGYIYDDNLTATSEQLNIVIEDEYSPDWLRMRAAFLNGQILQSLEKYADASANFERCLDFFPKIEMDFYARKYIAWNTLMAGQDVEDGMKPLKKVLNDGKYVSYHDQVYFVLGNLAAKAHKPEDAVKYLTLSAAAPKASKKQKALSFAALGDVEYGLRNYTEAKNAYDSSAKYSGANTKDASVIAAIQKSKGLSEISQPAGVIHDLDSLLELATLSKKEQASAVKHYLKQLEKKLQDSIKNAEESGTPTADAGAAAAADPAETANTWYFSNATNMQLGATDFKRKWGNRPLSDNWRRAAGQPFNNTAGNSGGLEEDNAGDEPLTLVNGLPTEESLLAKIPNTKEQKEAAIKNIQKAYIQLAKAYLKQLDDLEQTIATLDTLNSRYPNHNQKEEELYMRYQVALRKNMLDKAQAYSTELLSKFPNSVYAEILRPKTEANKVAVNGGKTVEQYYEETYDMIVDHKYSEALAQVENGKKSYNNPVFRKRFEIAEAMCYSGLKNMNMADTLIKTFIAANPGDSLLGWAKEIAVYINEIKTNGIPSWYNNKIPESGKIADAAKKPIDPVKPVVIAPVIPVRPPDVPVMYTYEPTEEHYGMVVISSLDSRLAMLKQKINAVDSVKGMTGATVLIDMMKANQIVLYVKKFNSEQLANNYMDTLVADSVFNDYQVEEYQTMVISAKNQKKMFYDKEPQKYKLYYSTYYKKP